MARHEAKDGIKKTRTNTYITQYGIIRFPKSAKLGFQQTYLKFLKEQYFQIVIFASTK